MIGSVICIHVCVGPYGFGLMSETVRLCCSCVPWRLHPQLNLYQARRVQVQSRIHRWVESRLFAVGNAWMSNQMNRFFQFFFARVHKH